MVKHYGIRNGQTLRYQEWSNITVLGMVKHYSIRNGQTLRYQEWSNITVSGMVKHYGIGNGQTLRNQEWSKYITPSAIIIKHLCTSKSQILSTSHEYVFPKRNSCNVEDFTQWPKPFTSWILFYVDFWDMT